jgi:hypothetical protein
VNGPFESGPLITIRFSMPDPEVAKNYRPKGLGHKLSFAERDQRDRLRTIAKIARDRGGWPADVFVPRRVRLTIQAYGGNWDANAFDTMVKDAMQTGLLFPGILYHDDKIVSTGEQHPAYDDGHGRRLVVVAELMDIWSQAHADAARRAHADRVKRRMQRNAVKKYGRLPEEMPLSEHVARKELNAIFKNEVKYDIGLTAAASRFKVGRLKPG